VNFLLFFLWWNYSSSTHSIIPYICLLCWQ